MFMARSIYSSFTYMYVYSMLHVVHSFINHKHACLSRTIAGLVKFPHVIRHTCNAQFTTELAPFAACRVTNDVLHASAVAFAVSLLDGPHVMRIPVVSNKARNEQLATKVIFARRRGGVVNKQGITNGAVDDTVENMSQKFTLTNVSY